MDFYMVEYVISYGWNGCSDHPNCYEVTEKVTDVVVGKENAERVFEGVKTIKNYVKGTASMCKAEVNINGVIVEQQMN